MAIDKEVEDSVLQVFKDENQSDDAARKFVAWLNDMSERELDGNEKLEHLELLRNKLVVG